METSAGGATECATCGEGFYVDDDKECGGELAVVNWHSQYHFLKLLVLTRIDHNKCVKSTVYFVACAIHCEECDKPGKPHYEPDCTKCQEGYFEASEYTCQGIKF